MRLGVLVDMRLGVHVDGAIPNKAFPFDVRAHHKGRPTVPHCIENTTRFSQVVFFCHHELVEGSKFSIFLHSANALAVNVRMNVSPYNRAV